MQLHDMFQSPHIRVPAKKSVGAFSFLRVGSKDDFCRSDDDLITPFAPRVVIPEGRMKYDERIPSGHSANNEW
jgi:hypothetical protein